MAKMKNEQKAEKRKFGKWMVFFLILLILVVAELFFDIFEIGFGRLLYWTNPVRPQTGRLWVEDKKEQEGVSELNSHIESSEIEQERDTPLRNFEELEALLSLRNSLSMTKDQFKEFYTTIPVKEAKSLLDPLSFIELDHDPEWQKAQFSLSGDQLVVYYLDGYERPIQDSYIFLNRDQVETEQVSFSELETNENFRNRTVPAFLFYQAFEKLPRHYQLQIVNDPYKLIQWGSFLQRVAISVFVEDNQVEIIFEVQKDENIKLYPMYASEMAIGYLIEELNRFEDVPKMSLPVKKEEYEKSEKNN